MTERPPKDIFIIFTFLLVLQKLFRESDGYTVWQVEEKYFVHTLYSKRAILTTRKQPIQFLTVLVPGNGERGQGEPVFIEKLK